MRRSIPRAAALLWTLACATQADAQDAHYWNYGYGPVGQLTEGALVGGVSDLSAAYYNPAACALIDEPRFLVGLNSVELASLRAPGAAGDGLDVDQVIFDVVPAMVAGHVGRHEGGRDHFAFAFLARHDSDFDLGYRDAAVSEASAAAGHGRSRQRLVEYWTGATWSRRIDGRVAVGVSTFFAHRGQRARRSLARSALDGGALSSLFVARELEYNHARVLAKLGVAWRPGRWQLGATVTTPGLKLWGNGKSIFSASASGDSRAPLLTAATETGLSPTYRSPWSVAGGATHRWRRTAVHASAEWFSAIAAYDVLRPAPAPVAGSPETIDLTYRGAARSVVNLALGAERQVGGQFVVYGGVARNRSSHVAQRDTFAPWDLDEVSAGFTFDRGGPKWALGVGYARGSGEIAQLVTPPGATPDRRRADYSRWTISVGASIGGR